MPFWELILKLRSAQFLLPVLYRQWISFFFSFILFCIKHTSVWFKTANVESLVTIIRHILQLSGIVFFPNLKVNEKKRKKFWTACFYSDIFLNLHNHHKMGVAENCILLALFIIYNLFWNSASFLLKKITKKEHFLDFFKSQAK